MANLKSQKDSEMAMRMKREGVERRSGMCPICYRQIALTSVYHHISATCTGPARAKGSNGPVDRFKGI